MNITEFATQASIIKGYSDHIVLAVVIIVITPLFTYLGLKKELKIFEQILAILLVFLTFELLIYLAPFIINSIKSIMY
jgi:hypothetical protein